MEIYTIVSGKLKNNTYVVKNNNKAIIIDANASANEIKKYTDGCEVQGVLITHGHFDHIESLQDIISTFGCKCYLHPKAIDKLFDPGLNESANFADANIICNIDRENLVEVQDEEIVNLIDKSIEIVYLPGHTDCGVGYIIDQTIFSGDTMFATCYGRTDLQEGDFKKLLKSLKKLMERHGYTLYSGHGDKGKIK